VLVYLISSQDEKERLSHIQDLEHKFIGLVHVEAIYPNKTTIPFRQAISAISKHRTGTALSNGALGCLLSHRKTWKKFLLQEKSEHCLIIESDSYVVDLELLNYYYNHDAMNYDLFYFGAFDGRMKLFKSKITKIYAYHIGEPYINSLYCTYGYMINKKTATYLLQSTSKFNYPVDYWKRRLKNANLKIGGIIPNLITTNSTFTSTITIKRSSIAQKLFDLIVDLKNNLITQFN
jgi:GR25 family glycosyltransferase involved in LPS biosynthesis